ncbi:hypothetical protein LCGC14_2274210 [marine sediment metagenome]|uniref:Uncharacterized protein n=1 Tax=marine sediment metagenome TaxID=412755 RepID=A0A0F9DIA5_9ZZZZ
MCLDIVTQIKSDEKWLIPNGKYRIGWKCCTVRDYGFWSMYNNTTEFRTWIKSTILKIYYTCGNNAFDKFSVNRKKSYPSGFHIFTTKAGAANYLPVNENIVQVRYRKIVACGIQRNYECIVAREMYVCKPK